MFHPVGSRPPSVYWRRRFVLLASIIAVLALLAITVKVLVSDGSGGSPAAGGTPGTSTRTSPKPHTSAPTTRSSFRLTKPAHPGKSSSSTSHSPSDPPSSASSTGTPVPCAPANLGLAAATNKKQYTVGEQLTLSVKVTNTGKAACVVDLGDPQVLLKVYNGESRVWGSHDCEVTPGKVERTLMADQTVKVSIVWSGLSARPNCAGARQRVGAGSYTLVAYLAGHKGTAAQFAIK